MGTSKEFVAAMDNSSWWMAAMVAVYWGSVSHASSMVCTEAHKMGTTSQVTCPSDISSNRCCNVKSSFPSGADADFCNSFAANIASLAGARMVAKGASA